MWRELSKILFWGVQVTTPYTDLKGEKSKISWVIWKCVVWKSQQQQQQQKMGKTSATEAALRPLYTLFDVYLHFLITPFYTFSDWLKFLVFKIDKTTWRIWSFEKELFSSFYKHFLDLFFNRWVILLFKNMSESFFNDLLDEKLLKILILCIVFLTILGYNLS